MKNISQEQINFSNSLYISFHNIFFSLILLLPPIAIESVFFSFGLLCLHFLKVNKQTGNSVPLLCLHDVLTYFGRNIVSGQLWVYVFSLCRVYFVSLFLMSFLHLLSLFRLRGTMKEVRVFLRPAQKRLYIKKKLKNKKIPYTGYMPYKK